jgi:dihydroneopterin aldolase
MSDRIHIKSLVLSTVVGVPDEERALPQSVSVNATLLLGEKSLEGIDDDLARTVDYYEVSQAMRKVASTGERKLIETLAEDLATAILQFDGVRSVLLEVEKFILPNCGAVSVEIKRSRE